MTKVYLCKDCGYNNNGWCRKRQMQGLKKIEECEFLLLREEVVNSDTVLIPQDEISGSLLSMTEGELDALKEQCKTYGKREMLYYILRQIEVMRRDKKKIVKVKEVMGIILALDMQLSAEESLSGINVDGETEKAIVEGSKTIVKDWVSDCLI